VATASAPAREPDVGALVRFGAEMAEKGNWREARFRWERAQELEPGNARILNNLAIAQEVLGHPGEAEALYRKALELSEGDALIADNASRAARFWQREETRAEFAAMSGGRRPRASRSETLRLMVGLPLPPKIDLSGRDSLLVASFLGDPGELLDLNREVVRFLRAEFRKRTSLDVLEVSPPPAVPEQTLEDLIANQEFWKFLGRQYEADVIVSGTISYGRRDVSGFREVDSTDPYTRQKVRQQQFVEQQQFMYMLEVLFFSGTDGSLLYRDRFQRSAIYLGDVNDPLTAFYDLSDSIAGDVLGAVTPRVRQDVRVIFRG
jgi:hypothetical protein